MMLPPPLATPTKPGSFNRNLGASAARLLRATFPSPLSLKPLRLASVALTRTFREILMSEELRETLMFWELLYTVL